MMLQQYFAFSWERWFLFTSRCHRNLQTNCYRYDELGRTLVSVVDFHFIIFWCILLLCSTGCKKL